MLQQLGWLTLECRRLEARANMMYKITNNLVQVVPKILILQPKEAHVDILSIFTIYPQE